MQHHRYRLTFPETQVQEPVIYKIVKEFDVIPSIRRASIENHFGWMVMDLQGSHDQINAAIAYLEGLGIDVVNAEGDFVAG
jgi:ABC-type methionine transport system ATPase subunit